MPRKGKDVAPASAAACQVRRSFHLFVFALDLQIQARYYIPVEINIKKMKCVALLALAGSAAAFAPTNVGRMSTSIGATAAQKDFFGLKENMDFSKELGVQAPVS